jgi:hypothetical protein
VPALWPVWPEGYFLTNAQNLAAGLLADSVIVADNLVTVLEVEIDRKIGVWSDMGQARCLSYGGIRTLRGTCFLAKPVRRAILSAGILAGWKRERLP